MKNHKPSGERKEGMGKCKCPPPRKTSVAVDGVEFCNKCLQVVSRAHKKHPP